MNDTGYWANNAALDKQRLVWYGPPTMNSVAIQLPDDLTRFVQQSVSSGAYLDTNDFVVSVIATFKEQVEAPFTDEEAVKLATLRTDVQHAADQLDRGEGIRDFDWDAFLAERHRAHAAKHAA